MIVKQQDWTEQDKPASKLTLLQNRRLYSAANDIIERLPAHSINQLLEGYSEDIDKLLTEIVNQTDMAMNFGRSLDTENLSYIDNLAAAMDERLRILSFNYFCATVLSNFMMGWRNLEWGNLTQLFPWSSYLCSRGSGKSYEWCYAFPLWRLYSYTKPLFYAGDTIDNKNRKETALITNTMTLAKIHVGKIIEEIETNPILSNKLNSNKKAKLGETMIETETGSILHVRGKDGFIRGLHVGSALIDDVPDESSIYSDEQREKLKETFRGTITPIVEPYGYLIVSGTPYSTAPNELYNIIKADKRFAVFEYPIIFPDGRPLAPDRYTFDDIIQKKDELGTMVFSREYLVVPIADSSTIFPYEFLMRSTVGMENISFADTIDYFPFKLQRVVVGCDFAVSGNIGADYTVYTVWGIDFMDNYYLIAIHRQKGMSHNEQVDKIVLFNTLFKPNKIVCEANGFQSILSGLARERGLKNIETFTTTEGNKKDLHTGLPSLSAMFERGQIKIPYAVGPTREMVKIIFGEFSSITFRSDRGKLEAVGAHDDICMSSFIAINSLREDSHITVQINTI
jgi:phage terminase large subunit-like protein